MLDVPEVYVLKAVNVNPKPLAPSSQVQNAEGYPQP